LIKLPEHQSAITLERSFSKLGNSMVPWCFRS
jgi:hypothetical protein